MQPIAREEDGKLSFHSVQDAINAFRICRIQKLKLAFPPLQPKKRFAQRHASMSLESTNGTHLDISNSGERDHSYRNPSSGKCISKVGQSNLLKKVDGLSNAEIFEKVDTHYIKLHKLQIERNVTPLS